MHIKFISTGKGSASAAKDYLLQKNDSKGEIRADIQVLRGNPEHVTQLAESLDFKYKYTSGVIAWHKDDVPMDNQIAQVLDDFERVAFAGLEPSQYAYYAVLHEDADGAKHIHVIAPRVELSTGLSMNIAPPNHQKTYDVLVDKYNVQHDWASPKDISRQKTMTIDKMQIHADTPNVQAKRMIHEVINELVERGSIKNNSDVRTKLAEFGEITREGKDYISIKPEGFKKAVRLKGVYYEREFSVERVSKEVRAEQEARARPNQADRSREYERISEVFENVIEDRAKFNQGRYIRDADKHQPKQQDLSREQQRIQQRDSAEFSIDEPRTHEDKSQTMDNPNSHGVFDSPSPSIWNVGNYQVPHAPTPRDNRQKSRDSEVRSDSREREEDTREIHNPNMGRTSTRSEEEAERMERQRKWTMGNRLKAQGELNDTIRERIKSNLADTRGDVLRRAKEHNEDLRKTFKGYNHSVHKTDERSVGSDRTAEQHDNKAERNIGKVREHISELADKFGRETSNKLRGLIHKAEGRVGELTASVKQFGEKAITKVKEIAKKAERVYSSSYGRGGMSR
jgi:hypothetical protein